MKQFRIVQERKWFYVQKRFMFLWFIPLWIYIEHGSEDGGTVPAFDTLGEAEKEVKRQQDYYSNPKFKVVSR